MIDAGPEPTFEEKIECPPWGVYTRQIHNASLFCIKNKLYLCMSISTLLKQT